MAYVGLADYYIVLPDYAPVPNGEATQGPSRRPEGPSD